VARRNARSPAAPRPRTRDAVVAEPVPVAVATFWTRRRLTLAVALLLLVHAILAVNSLVRENPTIDEVIHLPAGITYWQQGTFRLYPHNPPLVKLVAALPVIVSGVDTGPLYRSIYWRQDPPNKAGFAHEFAVLNADDYFELFTRARLFMPLFSVVGGLVVFAWSRRLYGASGGLLSLSLWVFCPNVLAHARLVTTDLGATALGVAASFVFWLYLQRPNGRRAALAGLVLGLAQLTKFSLILLLGVWPVLWACQLLIVRGRAGIVRRSGIALAHGALMLALCTSVIDLGYVFEGVGTPLGRFEFVSRTLTRPVPPGMRRPRSTDAMLDAVQRHRVNRFRGTWMERLPVPLPVHYVEGFDDQKMEAEGIPLKFLRPELVGPKGEEVQGYPVYLDGVLSPRSWWYYYLFAMAYKVPEGTWLLVAASLVVLVASPRSRATWFDEAFLMAMPLVVLVVMSFFTNINLGLRYVLPIFPFVFISTGKLAPWAVGIGPRVRRRLACGLIGVGLAANVAATLSIAPHYLAYFNAVSGGPARGSEHLIDSNLDWGQDLLALKRWLNAHARDERVGLAYFGQINPSLFELRHEGAIDWYLPPPLPGTMIDRLPPLDRSGRRPPRPLPGLYAVSASLMRGLPWRVYDNARWAPYAAGMNAFAYFQHLTPIAEVGHSIFVYRVGAEDAARLAPLWD
jgi:hypothetical protein